MSVRHVVDEQIRSRRDEYVPDAEIASRLDSQLGDLERAAEHLEESVARLTVALSPVLGESRDDVGPRALQAAYGSSPLMNHLSAHAARLTRMATDIAELTARAEL